MPDKALRSRRWLQRELRSDRTIIYQEPMPLGLVTTDSGDTAVQIGWVTAVGRSPEYPDLTHAQKVTFNAALAAFVVAQAG